MATAEPQLRRGLIPDRRQGIEPSADSERLRPDVADVRWASSRPGTVVRWIEGSGGLLKTAVTESQVIEVLQRPYFASKLRHSYLDGVALTFSKAKMVTITEQIAVCRDPTDDRFLDQNGGWASRGPRTRRPGKAPVASPFRYTTAPDTIVASNPSVRCTSRFPPAGRS
jgi:hypothetical protein